MSLRTSFILGLLILSICYIAVNAAEVEGTPNLAEAGLPKELEPVANTILPMLTKLSVVVGGIFGLYVILIIIRIYYERKNMKILQDIRYDLDQLNKHYHIGYSETKKGFFRWATSLVGVHSKEKADLNDGPKKK